MSVLSMHRCCSTPTYAFSAPGNFWSRMRHAATAVFSYARLREVRSIPREKTNVLAAQRKEIPLEKTRVFGYVTLYFS